MRKASELCKIENENAERERVGKKTKGNRERKRGVASKKCEKRREKCGKS